LMMVGPGFHASPTFLPSQANTSELGRRQFAFGVVSPVGRRVDLCLDGWFFCALCRHQPAAAAVSQVVPNDIAPHLFNSVGTVEIYSGGYPAVCARPVKIGEEDRRMCHPLIKCDA